MKAFEHVDAATARDAVRLLSADGSVPIAGGTDLLPRMKLGIVEPSRLVNLKTVRNLDKISFDEEDGLSLGALATLSDIAAFPAVRERYPGLARAISLAASPQLRNSGTIGGNIVQGSRCWYYRGDFDCWLKGGKVCYARDGRNSQHAIFGDSPCVTVHPSDPATALSALRAQVTIAGPGRSRRIPIGEFLTAPTGSSRQLTTLAHDELITEVRIPARVSGSRSVYVKAMERRVWSFALASVAAQLVMDGGIVRDASLVIGGAAATPWPVDEAADALRGRRLTDSSIRQAAEMAVSGARPLAENGYKIALVKGIVTSALTELKAGRGKADNAAARPF